MTTVDLEQLLQQIRLRGIPVGTAELQRLQTLFSHAPMLSRGELLGVLQTSLAKNQQQRQSIAWLFECLLPVTEEEKPVFPQNKVTKKPDQPPARTHSPQAATKTDQIKPAFWQRYKKPAIDLMVWATIILLLALLRNFAPSTIETPYLIYLSPPVVQAPEPPLPGIEPSIKTPSISSPQPWVERIDQWTPRIQIIPVNPLQEALPELMAWLALCLIPGGFLLREFQKHRIRPPNLPDIKHPGPGSYWISPNNQPLQAHLLDESARKTLGWSIRQQVSLQPGKQLDIPLTVKASAQYGIPSIHYRHIDRVQHIWLWQDQSANNPNLPHLAREIEQTLMQYRLPVQKGYFHGLPGRVMDAQGRPLWDLRHAYPDTSPLLIVLIDADNLLQPAHAQRQQQVLRHLANWEAPCCLVDCSQYPADLSDEMTGDHLDYVLPQNLPDWLVQQGDMAGHTQQEPVDLESLRHWAIACALPDRRLTEEDVRDLHDALSLDCAWLYPRLNRYARLDHAGLDFRAQRIKLLREFSQWVKTKPPQAEKIIQYWQKHYQAMDEEQDRRATPAQPWRNSLQRARLHLEQALLRLWLHPQQAASECYDLYGYSKMKKAVADKLAQYACADYPKNADQNRETINLSDRWHNLSFECRQQLAAAGFGGKIIRLWMPWDNTAKALVFFSVSTLAWFSYQTWQAIQPRPLEIVNTPGEELPPPQIRIQEQQTNLLLLGTTKQALPFKVPVRENQKIQVSWRKSRQKAQRPIAGMPLQQARHWLAGTQEYAKIPQPKDWPILSVVVIADAQDKPEVQQLAAWLLDNGTADQVITGNQWRQAVTRIQQNWRDLPNTQWLYVLPQGGEVPRYGQHIARLQMDAETLLDKLNQTVDRKKADSVQEKSTIQGFPGLIIGDPDRPQIVEDLFLVRVLQGGFWMGDKNNREKTELPPRKVVFSKDFWIGQTEVTFAQYQKYVDSIKDKKVPNDQSWGKNNRPVINVSWDDAVDYAKWLSDTNQWNWHCRLPSEAEWEYSARADNDMTQFSWGDKAFGYDKAKANCRECGSQWDYKQTAPVASFAPNAFGLYDMHGNVAEWTQDCWYDNYGSAPQDGSARNGKINCGNHVIRGGSWFDMPFKLRSSYRVSRENGKGGSDLGFRIVCSSGFDKD